TFDEVGGYREEWAGWEDQDLFLRLKSRGRVVVLTETLYHYRFHVSSVMCGAAAASAARVIGLRHRCLAEFRRGRDYTRLLAEAERNGPPPTAFADALYLRGSMRLWAGHPPAILGLVLRHKSLALGPRALRTLVWATWASVSPTSLRLFLRALIRTRDFLASYSVKDRGIYEWRLGGWSRAGARAVRSESGCELVACADSNEDVLRQSAAALGVPSAQCFRSLAETLETIDCDAVIVATAADCHAEACELALSHGRAVLVEKPFTTNLGEAVGLVRLAEQKGLPLVVAQNYRYMRSFRTVRRLVADGALGRVGIVICQYYRVPHTMVASLTRLPHSVLWGVGVHHLDALRYVLGQRVTGVAADSFTLPWGGLPPG